MKLDPDPLLALFTGPDRDTATTLGVTTRTIIRWRGGAHSIEPRNADRLAVAAGRTPYEIWPELVEQAVAEATHICHLTECATEFIPNRRGQVYCTPDCRRRAATIRGREQARRRYATDPGYRARKLEQAQTRREAARRADAITKRQWYRNNRDQALARRRARYLANADAEKARQSAYRARLRAEQNAA